MTIELVIRLGQMFIQRFLVTELVSFLNQLHPALFEEIQLLSRSPIFVGKLRSNFLYFLHILLLRQARLLKVFIEVLDVMIDFLNFLLLEIKLLLQ